MLKLQRASICWSRARRWTLLEVIWWRHPCNGQPGTHDIVHHADIYVLLYRNGYLYIIHLLIAHNADPTIADSQGYNTLHLVTHSSAIMPLLYLLHQPIAVDSLDAQGMLLQEPRL